MGWIGKGACVWHLWGVLRASCRSLKPLYRLSLTGLISSVVVRRASPFCMYDALVLSSRLRSALVNQHSHISEASPAGMGKIIWSFMVSISIKFQHCLHRWVFFPGVIRQYIHSTGRACWEVTHQALNRDLSMCLKCKVDLDKFHNWVTEKARKRVVNKS